MTIGFISMIRDPWGGSEELWYRAAQSALDRGDKVIHSAYDLPEMHPKRKQLAERGAILLHRPGIRGDRKGQLVKAGINFLRNRLKNPFASLFHHKPKVVLYTGTAYSIAGERYLHPWLDNFEGRFFILAQLNEESLRRISDEEAVLVKKYYQKAERVFFVSERNRNRAEHHLAMRIPNAVIIRNPVNLDDPRPLAYPASDISQLAIVGNLLTLHKGQDLVIAALGNAAWKNRLFHLNIYGKGPDEAYLRQLVQFYGLTDKVSFHGQVSGVSSIWERNQLLLMPSHMEGMPLAVVEAMLSARAVLATDVGGITEWIEDGVSGFVAGGASIPAVAAALEAAWSKRDQWKTMGLAAYNEAIKQYDPESGNRLYQYITG